MDPQGCRAHLAGGAVVLAPSVCVVAARRGWLASAGVAQACGEQPISCSSWRVNLGSNSPIASAAPTMSALVAMDVASVPAASASWSQVAWTAESPSAAAPFALPTRLGELDGPKRPRSRASAHAPGPSAGHVYDPERPGRPTR
jgi:hypothetical protein